LKVNDLFYTRNSIVLFSFTKVFNTPSEMDIAVSNCCISSREKNDKSADRVAEYLATFWNAASQFQISYRCTPDGNANGQLERKTRYRSLISRATHFRERAPSRNLWRRRLKFRYRYSCRFADEKYARMRTMCVCVCVCVCMWERGVGGRERNFFSSHRPVHHIPTLYFFIFFLTYPYVDVAISVSRASWSKTIMEEWNADKKKKARLCVCELWEKLKSNPRRAGVWQTGLGCVPATFSEFKVYRKFRQCLSRQCGIFEIPVCMVGLRYASHIRSRV